MTSRSVERLQASVPGSDKNAPKQITIPVSADGSIFHLCPCTGRVLCARLRSMYESTAVSMRDRKCARVRYTSACIEATHCHDPLEICACYCVSNARDRCCVRRVRRRDFSPPLSLPLSFSVGGLRVHMWRHEKRAKWTVTWGS